MQMSFSVKIHRKLPQDDSLGIQVNLAFRPCLMSDVDSQTLNPLWMVILIEAWLHQEICLYLEKAKSAGTDT